MHNVQSFGVLVVFSIPLQLCTDDKSISEDTLSEMNMHVPLHMFPTKYLFKWF
jgi:hypothetical protein